MLPKRTNKNCKERIATLIADEMKNPTPLTQVDIPPPIPAVDLQKKTIPAIEQKKVEQVRNTAASAINYFEEEVIPIKHTAAGTVVRTPIQNITPHRPMTMDEAQKQRRATREKPVVNTTAPTPAPLPAQEPEHPTDASVRNEQLLTDVKNVITTLKEYNTSGPRPIIDPDAFPEAAPPKKRKLPKAPVENTAPKKSEEVPQAPLTSMEPLTEPAHRARPRSTACPTTSRTDGDAERNRTKRYWQPSPTCRRVRPHPHLKQRSLLRSRHHLKKCRRSRCLRTSERSSAHS